MGGKRIDMNNDELQPTRCTNPMRTFRKDECGPLVRQKFFESQRAIKISDFMEKVEKEEPLFDV